VRPPGRGQLHPHLHGALLDAELLADVYINLTRGQDALLIDVSATRCGPARAPRGGPEWFDLPVLQANDQEPPPTRMCWRSSTRPVVAKRLAQAANRLRLWHNLRRAVATDETGD
jgi:DNA polymerase III epsilon subunit-like protein